MWLLSQQLAAPRFLQSIIWMDVCSKAIPGSPMAAFVWGAGRATRPMDGHLVVVSKPQRSDGDRPSPRLPASWIMEIIGRQDRVKRAAAGVQADPVLGFARRGQQRIS